MGPIEDGTEEDGEANDEPDIARGEEEKAGRGENIDLPGFREEIPEFGLLFGSSKISFEGKFENDEDDGQSDGHGPKGPLEAKSCEKEAAEEEADSFESVFGSGEDGDPFKEAGLCFGSVGGHENANGAL